MADMVFLTKLKPEPMGAYDASKAYGINSLVMSADGAAAYLSVKDVPAGTSLANTEYWKIHTDLSKTKQSAEEAAAKALAARDEMMEIARNLADPVHAEGNPVKVEDLVGGLPFDSVVTVLEPVQAGSGDPCPAGGGRNLIDMAQMTGNNVSIDVEHFDHGIRVYSTTAGTYHRAQIGDITLRAGVNYTISAEVTAMPGGYARVGFINQQSNVVISSIIFSKAEKKTTTFSVSEDTVAYFGAWCSWNTSIAGDATYANIQVEIGDVATDYAPYENIRPISGRTGAKLARTGKNLMPKQTFSGTFVSNGDGVYSLAANNTGASAVIKFPFKAGVNYTLSVTTISGTGLKPCIIVRDPENSDKYYSNYSDASKPVTVRFDNDTEWNVLLQTGSGAGHAVYGDKWALQIEIGETATEYEPYQGLNLSADFGQTVYGGRLDWQTGVLKADRAIVTLDGANQKATLMNVTSNYVQVKLGDYLPDARKHAGNGNLICSHLPEQYGLYSDFPYPHAFLDVTDTPYIRAYFSTTLAATVNEVNTYLADQYAAGTPVQVVYKLAAPVEIPLTPQEIKQLEGINTLYGDAGIDVNSRAKPGAQLISRIEALEAAILNA